MLFTPNSLPPSQFPSESALQQYCVSWFRWAYPHLVGALYAINNNSRNAIEGALHRSLGVHPGPSDLCLLLPGGLSQYIEMKLPDGKQSRDQKEWEQLAISLQHKYTICRNFDTFKAIIEDYYGIKKG